MDISNSYSKEMFSLARTACRLHQDAWSIFWPKIIATMELMLTMGVMGGHESVWKEKKDWERFSKPAKDVLCGSCNRCWGSAHDRLVFSAQTVEDVRSLITSRSDKNFQMPTSRPGLLSLIIASRRWRKIWTFRRGVGRGEGGGGVFSPQWVGCFSLGGLVK